MRPYELRLRGFRSYRDEVTFDWRRRRLVGIVGPIGSGKSSILDAIAFALYGKTPTFERDTKSLIHQLADACHVELRFEVDGQVWRAVRSLRRKGASGHQLCRLADDGPDAEPLEQISGERPVRERVVQLLGMEFDAFCRSVLLAQNRFADFLRATPSARNEVLKGIFGYERFDAALEGAKRRVASSDVTLEALSSEGERLADARARLDEARERSVALAERAETLEQARRNVEAASEERRAAEQSAAAASLQVTAVDDAIQQLGTDAADELFIAAEDAESVKTTAAELVVAAEAALRTARDTYAAVVERIGDQAAFAALVQEHDHRAATAEDSAEVARLAAGAVEAADREAGSAGDAVTEAERAAEVSAEARTTAQTDLAEAEETMHAAQHAVAARTLRAELVAGDPCPVCHQPIAVVPGLGRAPAVTAAEKACARARDRASAAVATAQEAASRVAGVRATLEAASRKQTDLREAAQGASERARLDETALAAIKSELVDRLGEGDPHALLETRDRELQDAQAGRDRAEEMERLAREQLDGARGAADAAREGLGRLATRLAAAWATIGDRRDIDPDPAALRRSYMDLGETLVARRASAEEAVIDADRRAGAAEAKLTALREELGLGPRDDLALALAEAAAARGAAEQEVAQLTETIEAGADLEARLLAAGRTRDLAMRLAADLQPSRFLAYLLEEERAALALIGSTHFDALTGGAYRFTDDDRFNIVDLNAAGTERRADSLSGGETFLASLALALALAEMVARGRGRLDAFFLDEGFGSLDPEHLDRAMSGIEHLVAEDGSRLVVLVSHVAEMREVIEDLIVLDKDGPTGDTVVVSGAQGGSA